MYTGWAKSIGMIFHQLYLWVAATDFLFDYIVRKGRLWGFHHTIAHGRDPSGSRLGPGDAKHPDFTAEISIHDFQKKTKYIIRTQRV